MLLILVVLSALLYYDARFLKRLSQAHYEKFIIIPPSHWGLWGCLAFVVSLPLYAFRRRQYSQAIVLFDRDRLLFDCLGTLVNWLCVTMVFSLCSKAAAFFYPGFDNSLTDLLLSAAFSSGIMVVFIYQATRLYPDGGFKNAVGLRKPKPGIWAAIAMAVLLGVAFAAFSSIVVFSRDTQPMTPFNEAIENNNSPWAFLLLFFLAVFTAPFLEEIIFRGYFFQVIQTLKGKRIAIFVIAFLFALMHVHQYWGDWLAIAAVACLGLGLTVLRSITHSSIPGIVTHYVYNGCVVIIPFFILYFSNPFYFQYMTQMDRLNHQQKIELLEKSLIQQPEFYELYNELAWTYAEKGEELDRALGLVETALAQDAENDYYLDTKAEILYRLGRVNEAVAIESALVERFPDFEFYAEQLQRFKGK